MYIYIYDTFIFTSTENSSAFLAEAFGTSEATEGHGSPAAGGTIRWATEARWKSSGSIVPFKRLKGYPKFGLVYMENP